MQTKGLSGVRMFVHLCVAFIRRFSAPSRSVLRRRDLSIVLLVSLAGLALPILPASAHQAPKRCYSPNRIRYGNVQKLRAHGPVGCNKARRIGSRWDEKCFWGGGRCDEGQPEPIRVRPGYTCIHRIVQKPQNENPHAFVKCRAKGDRVVHFIVVS